MKQLSAKIKRLTDTGFIHIFGASAMNQVLSFLSGIILVRVLTKPDYGVFSDALNTYQFFVIFSGAGIAVGILQLCSEYCEQPDISDEIYAWSSSFGICVNVVLALVIFVSAWLIPFPIDGTSKLLAVFCGLPFFTLMYEMAVAKLRGELRAKAYSYANMVGTITYCGFSIAGALIGKSVGLIVGRYVAYIATIFFIWKKFGVHQYFEFPKLNREIKKVLLKVSIVSLVNNGLTTLFNALEVFIIGVVIVDSSVTATYKVASTIPTALSFVPLAFAVYVYPYFAKHIGQAKWLKSNLLKSLGGLALINVIIALGLIVFSRPFIVIVFGEQYTDCLPIFRLLMISYLIGGTFRTLPGNLLVSQRKLAYNTVVSVIGCSISILGNVILIPRMGSIGAAWSHFIVIIVTAIMNTGGLLYFIRKSNISDTSTP